MRSLIIVDDNQEFASPLVAAIRKRGIECRYVYPSKRILSDLATWDCGLLITDVLMPEVDGLELIRMFRAHFPEVPIIAMSGGGDMLPASMGLQLSQAFGANTVLVKPFTLSEFFAVISEFLPAAGAL